MNTLETQLRALLREHSPNELHRTVDAMSHQVITISPNRHTPIYPEDQVPPGLATFVAAEARFGLRPGRIKAWLFRGHIRERGRVRAAARGGGKILVAIDDVARLVADPPRRTGRPPKSKTEPRQIFRRI